MPKSRHKRRTLITGGTGSVGHALVKHFASHGDDVTFLYRSQSAKAKKLSKACKATAIKIDFAQSTKLPRHHFDVLVNNAGINITDEKTHDVTLADWNETIFLNLTVPFLLTKQCLPWMMKKKWGRIINISSIYGLRAAEGNFPYTVSKHGLSGATKTIAKEYAACGITCNEICPGPIESDMMRRIASEQGRKSHQTASEYLTEVCEEIPMGRLAAPRDIARVAFFLASSKAEYLTGCSIPLDGGMIA